MTLKYTGNGRNVANIPAHDLSDEELETIALRDKTTVSELTQQLVKSGLYRKARKQKTEEIELPAIIDKDDE